MCRRCKSFSTASGSAQPRSSSHWRNNSKWEFSRVCLLLVACSPANWPLTAAGHRNFNCNGGAFDVGETFSGVDYEVGLEVVEEIRMLLPPGVSMAQFALRWIVMFDAVTCAI